MDDFFSLLNKENLWLHTLTANTSDCVIGLQSLIGGFSQECKITPVPFDLIVLFSWSDSKWQISFVVIGFYDLLRE